MPTPTDPAERLALAAVLELGPAARAWVDRTKARYPSATPDALARLAAWEMGRRGRWRAITSGAAGLAGPVLVAGTLARAQAELVLTIAAAYGHDPVAPARAAELVELLRAPRLTGKKSTAAARTAGALAALATRVAAARLVPFGGPVWAAAESTRVAADVARRAVARYSSGV
jgi:hypothetical protein